MNCAWCGGNADGSQSHGICDDCMQQFFHVNPVSIHVEIAQEEAEKREQEKGKVAA